MKETTKSITRIAELLANQVELIDFDARELRGKLTEKQAEVDAANAAKDACAKANLEFARRYGSVQQERDELRGRYDELMKLGLAAVDVNEENEKLKAEVATLEDKLKLMRASVTSLLDSKVAHDDTARLLRTSNECIKELTSELNLHSSNECVRCRAKIDKAMKKKAAHDAFFKSCNKQDNWETDCEDKG